MNLDYPVSLSPDTNGTLLVAFPDVPEAHTFGENEADALARAIDALETALEFYIDDARDLPRASRPRRGQHSVRPSVQACVKLAIYQAMRDDGVRKSELARRMGWHMPPVDRLLDLHHATRLEHAKAALCALGRTLDVHVRKAA